MHAPLSCLLRNCGRYVAASATLRSAFTPIAAQKAAIVSVSFWMSGTVDVAAYVLSCNDRFDCPASANSFLAPSASYGTALASGLNPGVTVGMLLVGVVANPLYSVLAMESRSTAMSSALRTLTSFSGES